MAWTTAQLDELRDKAARGVLSVRDADGKTTTFRSLDEMLKLISIIEGATATTRPRSVSYLRPRISRPRSGG